MCECVRMTLSTQYCNNRIHSASCDSVCCIYAPTVLIAFLNSSGAELLLPTPTGCLAASLRLKKTTTAQKNAQARSSAAEHVHNEESGESRQTSERTAYCAEKKKKLEIQSCRSGLSIITRTSIIKDVYGVFGVLKTINITLYARACRHVLTILVF